MGVHSLSMTGSKLAAVKRKHWREMNDREVERGVVGRATTCTAGFIRGRYSDLYPFLFAQIADKVDHTPSSKALEKRQNSKRGNVNLGEVIESAYLVSVFAFYQERCNWVGISVYEGQQLCHGVNIRKEPA